jgi:hypothetical protein
VSKAIPSLVVELNLEGAPHVELRADSYEACARLLADLRSRRTPELIRQAVAAALETVAA